MVIGGARSGKSRYAMGLAEAREGQEVCQVAFIATAQAGDAEMLRRIAEHRKARPAAWQTFEEPFQICTLLERIGDGFTIILLDCLTLWLSNLLLDGTKGEGEILDEVEKLITVARARRAQVVIVSNEVGMGIVPSTSLGRTFRDLAGRANQLLAREADEVVALWVGLPLKLKEEARATVGIPGGM